MHENTSGTPPPVVAPRSSPSVQSKIAPPIANDRVGTFIAPRPCDAAPHFGSRRPEGKASNCAPPLELSRSVSYPAFAVIFREKGVHGAHVHGLSTVTPEDSPH
jgi:hypothetical protein